MCFTKPCKPFTEFVRIHHSSDVHNTIKCHSKPDSYQQPLCCLALGGVGTHHVSKLTQHTEKKMLIF